MRRRVIVLLLVLVVALAAAIYFIPAEGMATPGEAAAWLRGVGRVWWSPLAYAALYVVFTLILVPPLLMSAAAALMWGWFAGGVVELLAATIAAVPPYSLARWTAADWVRQRLERHGAARVYQRIEKEGFLSVLLFRLVPVVPYVLLNYISGLAAIRSWRYVAATFLGMIPSIFVFTYFVDTVARGTDDLYRAVPRMLLAGGAVAALVLLTRAVAGKLR